MSLKKAGSLDTIKRMSDNSSMDDIMYKLNFKSKVIEGKNDADEGKIF